MTFATPLPIHLYCPFRAPCNPHVESVQRGTMQWVERCRLVPAPALASIDEIKIGWLAGYLHPFAPQEALQLISDWYIWMFLWDDWRDSSELGRNPQRLAGENTRYLDLLTAPNRVPPADALAVALAELRSRLVAVAGDGLWWRRFLHQLQIHFDATVWEASNRAEHIVPPREGYIRMRPITAGLNLDAVFMDLLDSPRLPAEAMQQPGVERLSQACNNAICWFNDLVSLPKELARNDVHNLVLIVQAEQHVPLWDATEQVATMLNRELELLETLPKQLAHSNSMVDQALQQYARLLGLRACGHLEWSLLSGRYRIPHLAIELLRT